MSTNKGAGASADTRAVGQHPPDSQNPKPGSGIDVPACERMAPTSDPLLLVRPTGPRVSRWLECTTMIDREHVSIASRRQIRLGSAGRLHALVGWTRAWVFTFQAMVHALLDGMQDD